MSSSTLLSDKPELPKQVVIGVIVLSIVPSLLTVFLGPGTSIPLDLNAFSIRVSNSPDDTRNLVLEAMRPRMGYALCEWTAGMIAIFTSSLAMFHYLIRQDVVTPVIGTALFFAGLIDLCHVLGVMGWIVHRAPDESFIPFTWFLSRMFHVGILILGIAPFLKGRYRKAQKVHGPTTIFLYGLISGAGAYSLVSICAVLPTLPNEIFAIGWIKRPLDLIPLVFYIIAGGIVLPRFYRQRPSRFAHALMISIFPHAAAQFAVVFGGDSLFARDVYLGSLLKTVGYAIPMVGLFLDYAKAHRAEAQLLATQEKLHIARNVQQDLLPKSIPEIDSFAIAGMSVPANAVGGDYYDVLAMPEDHWGIVVADVSGHEIGSAILMSQTRAYLRALGSASSDAIPLLRRLSHFLNHDVRGSRFVCLLFARIHPRQETADVFCLGHEAYLVRADGSTEQIATQSAPLGIAGELEDLEPQVIKFREGDLLLFVTDGITETLSPHGEQYGMDRVLETIAVLRDESPDALLRELKRSVDLFSNSSPQVDDQTIVIIKRTPAVDESGDSGSVTTPEATP